MSETILDNKFKLKREISEQLQDFKEQGPEVFIARKKKKNTTNEVKVNNTYAFGSDEEELYEQTL